MVCLITDPETDGKHSRVGPFADRAEATTNLREPALRGCKPFIAEEGRKPR
jgi:hypothetical protein